MAPLLSQMQITERGASIQTERFHAEISDGVLARFFNALTGEEFLDSKPDLSKIVPHIPTGFGTQNGTEAFAASGAMYHMPWAEHSPAATWPNKHFPDAESEFTGTVENGIATLVYKNLTNGTNRFPGDVFQLEIQIDAETGDLLITPSGSSPEPGVYASNLTISPLAPEITVEAPIFDGVRLDADMEPMLWVNTWAGYWDYAFVALNGRRTGAVGIWTQDPKFQYYKHFFYLINDQGMSLAFGGMNVPPFEDSRESKTLTWRLQAFDKSWAQAAARFREWREKEVQFAKRPDWNQDISFVNSSVNASKNWLDILSAYLEGRHLERTVSFLATVRAANFDTRHYDNTPYAEFARDTAAWKESGAKSMPYLQPMIMWGGGKEAPTEDEKKTIEMAAQARTKTVFQEDPDKSLPFYDKHHLGYKPWQDWFVSWVNEYIKLGADAIYHDETYMTPIDRRGLEINGKTSPQGLAEYFYRVQTENPNSIHASEHLNEINTVGASLGIGSGIHWGTAGSMRHQRISKTSPVSNSLAYPHGAIFSFPHQSELRLGATTKHNWGTDIMEQRGEIAGRHVQSVFLTGAAIPFTAWVNEMWLAWKRDNTFVEFGLRPSFPEDWDRRVLSYFQAKNGDQFRYVETGWGTQFLQIPKDGKPKPIYGRIHGVMNAVITQEAGGVFGWIAFNDQGMGGFDPSQYYVVDPRVQKPEVFIEAKFTESYVDYAFANDNLLLVHVLPLPEKGSINGDGIIIRSPKPPLKIWVNGKDAPIRGDAEKGYSIGIRGEAHIAVLFEEPPKGLENLNEVTTLRSMSELNLDMFRPEWLTEKLAFDSVKISDTITASAGITLKDPIPGNWRNQIIVPLAPPAGAKKGEMKIYYTGQQPLQELTWNGLPNANAPGLMSTNSFSIPMSGEESGVLTISANSLFTVGFEWIENTEPAEE